MEKLRFREVFRKTTIRDQEEGKSQGWAQERSLVQLESQMCPYYTVRSELWPVQHEAVICPEFK